jgi:predicted PurR-regulated permease PerM
MSRELNAENDAAVARAVETAIRLGLIGAMLLLCYLVVRPFLIPIAWALIIAIAVAPGYGRLVRLLRGRRVLASVVFTLIALVLLILPVIMLSGTLVEGAQNLAKGFEEGGWRIPPAPDLSRIPLVGDDVESFWNHASTNLEEALRTIEPQLQKLGAWLLSFAAGAGIGLLHFVLAIAIAAVLLAKGDSSAHLGRAIARRLAGERGDHLAHLAGAVVRSVSRGILGVALIQAILAGLGMLVAGVPAAGLWALLALLLSTVQIGVFPVLLPAVIYVFYAADTQTAVLFLLWALFVGSIDNVLKPLLLGRGVSVPMPVIFIGAIGGFIGAGIIGLFVGPVILALGHELFIAWLRHEPSPIAAPAMGEAAAGPGPDASAGD